MSFREALHRHLEALSRASRHARLFATPLEIYEASDAGLAVLHLLYCEDQPGRPPRRSQSRLELEFQCRGGTWVRVRDRQSPIR